MSQKSEPTVLIVNDSAHAQALQADILREAGFKVLNPALNGFDAVEQYLSQKPTLVVMDTVMPFKNGVAATAEIMAKDPQALVMMSAPLGQESLVLEALELGAVNFVSWPCMRLELKVLARKVVGLPVDAAEAESMDRHLEQREAAQKAPKSVAVVFSCRVDATDSSGAPAKPEVLMKLDGATDDAEPLAQYIWPDDPLAAIGLEGGELVLQWDAKACQLRVSSTFLAPRRLSDEEGALLLEFVRGQWSDGAGENFDVKSAGDLILSITGEDILKWQGERT